MFKTNRPKFKAKEARAKALKFEEGAKNQECWTCEYRTLLDYQDRKGNDIVYCNMLCEYKRKKNDPLCLFYITKKDKHIK